MKRTYRKIEKLTCKAVTNLCDASLLAYEIGDYQLAEKLQKDISKLGNVLYGDKVWTNCESAEEVVALFGDRL